VKPHGDGGEPSIENIALRCRAHNHYEADVYYGPGTSAVRRTSRQQVTPIRPQLGPDPVGTLADDSRSRTVRGPR
jgi:hypothetical protein